jgi:hypothetical protein
MDAADQRGKVRTTDHTAGRARRGPIALKAYVIGDVLGDGGRRCPSCGHQRNHEHSCAPTSVDFEHSSAQFKNAEMRRVKHG